MSIKVIQQHRVQKLNKWILSDLGPLKHQKITSTINNNNDNKQYNIN